MTTAAEPLAPPAVEPTLPGTDDVAPDKPKRRRSGTSGAERARRAKAAGGDKPATDKRPRAPRPTTRAPKLAPRIEAAHVVVGGLFAHATPLKQTGAQLAVAAKPAGDFWEQAAAQNPRVREIWERFLTTGLLVQGLAIYAPVVVVMLAELKVIPADRAQLAAGMFGAFGGATVAEPTVPAPGSAPVNVVDLPPRDG